MREPKFNQEASFSLLRELCSLGPRNHGSEGKARAERWIENKLREAGAALELHQFTYTPQSSQPEEFRNIIGKIGPTTGRRVMIGTHYDTRSWADLDPNKELRTQPIPGANDGGSGVAALLEMARAWKDDPPPIGIDFFFFDGEDFGRDNRNYTDYFLGSKAWVRDHPDYKPSWGIVLDMVGYSSLQIRKERISTAKASHIVQRVWDAAERVHSKAFVDQKSAGVFDDHSAFLDRGVPVILIIDLDYPPYHTLQDVLEQCSAESLGQVGRAIMEAVNTPEG